MAVVGHLPLFLLMTFLGCTSSRFTAGPNTINPPSSREKGIITAQFLNSLEGINACISANDSILPRGKMRDFLYVVNGNGKFYLGRISQPGAPKRTIPAPISLEECISKSNWADSIFEDWVLTLICARFSKSLADSIHLDTFAVTYSKCNGRSRSSIMHFVMSKVPQLEAAYGGRIYRGYKVDGRIQVKFAIDEFGRVIFCKVIDSAIKFPEFEEEIEGIISNWKFGEIACPGNVTEVVYPFNFSLTR
jgi:hypothetical protein